jgi:hypothetical protein
MILKKAHRKLEQMSSKAGIITLFLLAHSVLLSMMLFTFPRINAQLGTQAFDLKTFGYSPAEANMMLQNLDQSTIDFYLFPQLFFLDILYPILLALFLSAVITRLSVLIKIRPNHILSNLYLLPFIAMFMDYLENVMISLLITNSTDVSLVVVKLASILTQMKGAFTTLSWIIIVVLFGIWLKNKWHNSRTQNCDEETQ